MVEVNVMGQQEIQDVLKQKPGWQLGKEVAKEIGVGYGVFSGCAWRMIRHGEIEHRYDKDKTPINGGRVPLEIRLPVKVVDGDVASKHIP